MSAKITQFEKLAKRFYWPWPIFFEANRQSREATGVWFGDFSYGSGDVGVILDSEQWWHRMTPGLFFQSRTAAAS
jgi:hypothetical protein